MINPVHSLVAQKKGLTLCMETKFCSRGTLSQIREYQQLSNARWRKGGKETPAGCTEVWPKSCHRRKGQLLVLSAMIQVVETVEYTQ